MGGLGILLDLSNITPTVVFLILGAVLLTIGITGGDMRYKDIRIPKISGIWRALSVLCGVVLLPLAVWQTLSTQGPAARGKPGPSESDKSSAGLVCHILPGGNEWTAPGQVFVSLDGKQVGSFSGGKDGNTALDFACAAGPHKVEMLFVQPAASGKPSYQCATGITVASDASSFDPFLNISVSNGIATVTCSLRPVPVAQPSSGPPR